MVGCIITPTRGDRPQWLERCKRMVAYQTLQLGHLICNYPPETKVNDIAERYFWLFDEVFRERDYDYAIVFEDDDYYPADYCETLVNEWNRLGNPALFGQDETIYIHINSLGIRVMKHPNRSSMMSMLLTKEVLNMQLSCSPFIDLEISKAKTFKAIPAIGAIGIKHGDGVTVGAGHKAHFNWDKKITKEYFNKLTNGFYA